MYLFGLLYTYAIIFITDAEIKSKFDNLKATYAKINKGGKTGQEGKKNTWPYFEQMMFLAKTTCQRDTFSNTQVNIYIMYQNRIKFKMLLIDYVHFK